MEHTVQCPNKDCPKTFANNDQLISHIRHCDRTFTGNFVCPTCDKRLSSKQNLKEHMFIHTGEMPYKCTQCEAAFRQNSQLSSHKKIHRAIAESLETMIAAESRPVTITPTPPETTSTASAELLEFTQKLGSITGLSDRVEDFPTIELPLIPELGFFDVRELTKFKD